MNVSTKCSGVWAERLRFIENGADIEARLIDEVALGGAVVICGAGASKRGGRSRFMKLVAP